MTQESGAGEPPNGDGRLKTPAVATSLEPLQSGIGPAAGQPASVSIPAATSGAAAVAVLQVPESGDGVATVKTGTAGSPPQVPPMSRGWTTACLLYSLLAFIVPLACVVARQTDAPHAWTGVGEAPSKTIGALQGLPWIAAVGASMGALHSLASLSVRAGNETLYAPWRLFYFARPFTGAGVAAVTFLVLVSGIGGFDVTSPIAHLGWAALAGLYSEQALAKLRDVFAALLKPEKQDAKDARTSPPSGANK